jgi:hypothetical protein
MVMTVVTAKMLGQVVGSVGRFGWKRGGAASE